MYEEEVRVIRAPMMTEDEERELAELMADD